MTALAQLILHEVLAAAAKGAIDPPPPRP